MLLKMIEEYQEGEDTRKSNPFAGAVKKNKKPESGVSTNRSSWATISPDKSNRNSLVEGEEEMIEVEFPNI